MFVKKINLTDYNLFTNKTSSVTIQLSKNKKYILIKNVLTKRCVVIEIKRILSSGSKCNLEVYNNNYFIVRSTSKVSGVKFYTKLIESIKISINTLLCITYLKGLGYRYESCNKNNILMQLNFSSIIKRELPYTIGAIIKDNLGIFFSYDKSNYLKTIKNIQKLRYPDYYKNKGIHIYGESYFLKSSK